MKPKYAGFVLATYGTMKKATHAQCKCGRIVRLTADSHPCRWQLLLKVREV